MLDVVVNFLAKYSVPWRDDERDIALGSCLAGETHKRLFAFGLVVAEDFHLAAFARFYIVHFFLSAEYADPAGAARGGSAFDRHGAFPAAAVQFLPILRTVQGRGGRDLLFVRHGELALILSGIVLDREFFVDRLEEAEQPLRIVLCTLGNDRIG